MNQNVLYRIVLVQLETFFCSLFYLIFSNIKKIKTFVSKNKFHLKRGNPTNKKKVLRTFWAKKFLFSLQKCLVNL